jgi:hypothetical protein
MIKRITVLFATALFLASSAYAAPDFSNATLTAPGTQRELILPPAAENSNVISLGDGIDPQTGQVVQGFAIIHKKLSQAKPNGAGGTKNQCYGFLASGAKWKNVEPWIVNGANSEGLDPNFIESNLSGNIAKWETAAGVNILGTGSQTNSALVADTSSPDGQNEAYFANVSSSGSIAVTIVWGIFSGPPSQRQLVEWDQVYDDTDFNWSASGEAGKMDFENISTHELGHSVGLADLYNSCTQETMYGYAQNGETQKRDLNAGDVAGVASLY